MNSIPEDSRQGEDESALAGYFEEEQDETPEERQRRLEVILEDVETSPQPKSGLGFWSTLIQLLLFLVVVAMVIYSVLFGEINPYP